MFDKFAIVYPEAAQDIGKIVTSGKYGVAVLEAILSEMRPDEVYYATTSMTYKQMFPFFDFAEDATERAKTKATSKAVRKATDSGGLVRLRKGTVGHASVYTFRVYYVAFTERAKGNQSEGDSYQNDGDSHPEGMEQSPFDAPVVTPDTYEMGAYPYSSITIHNHPQGGGSSEEGKTNMTIPTGEEWYTYCKERGYVVDAYEYGKLAMRGFTDANGEPIKDWKAYLDKVHRNDRPEHGGEAQARGTVQCPQCGNHVTVTRQEDGAYLGGCQYCRIPVTATEDQLIKRQR